MSRLQKYTPISREQFEDVLAKFSVREVPDSFYAYQWEKVGARDWKWVRRKDRVWEICYVAGIHANAGIVIYSSINRATGVSRPRGEDAIRFVIADKDMKPRSKERRMNRTGNWKENLLNRIWELIKEWKHR